MINDILTYLKPLFVYVKGQPVIFTQLYFWGFFSVVLAIYSLLYKKNNLRTFYLLLVSFFFYYKTSGIFLILLIFTIVSDYNWGRLIHKTESVKRKKLYVTISMILNLTLLCYFKYAYFFVESVNQLAGSDIHFFNYFTQFSNTYFSTNDPLNKLILPVGVSFFTFQSISYTIDMYRGKVTPVKSIYDYGFFVCFFPHLVAGPIVKANEFLYQIYQPYNLTRKEFGYAVFWIINGLGKKILADYIAVNYIDRVFDNPNYYSGVETVFGIFGYSLQIYADFSGYTDIAIGIALLLGYRLKTNFKSPYKAQDVSEFWKRWHISLSTWLKDYLYIPLGGNKQGTIGSYICIAFLSVVLVMLTGKIWLLLVLLLMAIVLVLLAYFFPKVKQSVNTNINLLVTMLLGGFWHGSSWLFIIWGGLNGLGLVVHKLWHKISPFKESNSFFVKGFLVLLTLTFISFTRIFFRSDSLETVNLIFDRITNHFGAALIFDIIRGYALVFSVMLLGYLIHWIPESAKERYRSRFAELPLPAMSISVVAFAFCIYQMVSGEMQPFIYFQF
ncbi:MAG: putative alginate O-acetyltransferase [Bacteroidetes bacterium]|nr:putative alginate O-acetyltransferase [Bacteroidota bacterium]